MPPWTEEQRADLNQKMDTMVVTMEQRIMAALAIVHDEVKVNEQRQAVLRGETQQAVDQIRSAVKAAEDLGGSAQLDAANVNADVQAVGSRVGLLEQAVNNMSVQGTDMRLKVDGLVATLAAGGAGSSHGSGPGQSSKEFVDLKQMRPENLKSAEQFRHWRETFENYCELVESGVKEILKKIGNGRGKMSDQDLKDACGQKNVEELNRRLSNALVGYTEGEAKRIVKTAGAGNGMQAYQELCSYYDLKTDASENKLQAELLGMASKPAKNLKEVRQMLVDMESRRTKIEEMGGEVPKSKSLRAILVGFLDDETRRHIGEAIGAMDYNDAKKRVNDYVTVNLDNTANKKSEAMDLDRCAAEKHGHVEGGNEDGEHYHEGEQATEYSNDEWETYVCALKGKGKGKSNQVCYNCGKTGHFAKDCWSPKGVGKGKAGKGNEEKGKGKGKRAKRGMFHMWGSTLPE